MTQRTIRPCIADPISVNVRPTSVTIVIEDAIPKMNGLKEHRRWSKGQAEMLEQALYYSLPQCTYDALLRAMFVRKASFYQGIED